MTLFIFSVISHEMLGFVRYSQGAFQKLVAKEEAYLVGHMARQSHQTHLSLNGHTIQIKESKEELMVYEEEELIFQVKKVH